MKEKRTIHVDLPFEKVIQLRTLAVEHKISMSKVVEMLLELIQDSEAFKFTKGTEKKMAKIIGKWKK